MAVERGLADVIGPALKSGLLGGALLAAVATIAGCGGQKASRPIHRVARRVPTPTLAHQVRAAERQGPGFLDYCPLRNGQSRARYSIDVPGNPLAPGWCRTVASRGGTADSVTFYAYWDGRRIIGKSGTMMFRYSVPRSAGPHATPTPILVAQGGQLPP